MEELLRECSGRLWMGWQSIMSKILHTEILSRRTSLSIWSACSTQPKSLTSDLQLSRRRRWALGAALQPICLLKYVQRSRTSAQQLISGPVVWSFITSCSALCPSRQLQSRNSTAKYRRGPSRSQQSAATTPSTDIQRSTRPRLSLSCCKMCWMCQRTAELQLKK